MDLQRPFHLNSTFLERCACGREFYTSGAASNHTRTCKKAKTRRSGALEKAREAFRSVKRLKRSPIVDFDLAAAVCSLTIIFLSASHLTTCPLV